ncbi:MAG: hypothetical protein K6U89_18895 [Chloroflexi bacterium]|nr:hypothetical protein [Chloroflexota bacterium]
MTGRGGTPRERWSREKIVERLRSRQSAGSGLGAGTVLRDEPKLYYAARSLFGSWSNAVQAAGVDPASVPRRPRVTREAVLDEFRRWASSHPDASATALQRANPRLYMRAYRLFGGWAALLDAAGLANPPADVAEDELERLSPRELYELWQNPESRSRALRKAILRRFGSVHALKEAAGVAVTWTPEKVVSALRDLAAAGQPLGVSTLRAAGHSGLAAAAMRLFGSFRAACEAAGVQKPLPDYDRLSAEELYKLWRTGRPRPEGLAGAIRKRFGSVAALRKAALPTAYWTRERVVSSLREFAASGRPPTAGELRRTGNSGLAAAARKLFGSLSAAREAAGLAAPRPSRPFAELPPSDLYVLWRSTKPRPAGLRRAIRERFGSVAALRKQVGAGLKWTHEDVIRVLRELAASGHPLTTDELHRNGPPGLVSAAVRRFGSLGAAREAAGVARGDVPARRRTADSHDRPSEARMEDERSSGLYRRRVEQGRDPRLRRDIEGRSGSGRGLVAHPARKRAWTEEGVIKALRGLARTGLTLDASTVRRVDPGLLYAVYRYFGSLPAARRAAGLPDPADRRLAGLPEDLSTLDDAALYRLFLQHPNSRRLLREIHRRHGSLRAFRRAAEGRPAES